MQAAGPRTGFTLIELVVALAVVSIMVALGVAALSSLGRLTAPQTAASELSAHLSEARALAVEKSMDVWVVYFETLNKTGAVGTGQGGYIVLGDPDFSFGGLIPAPAVGEWRLATMPIPNCETPLTPTAGRVKVLRLVCYEQYSGANVLAADVGAAPFSITLPAPFLSLNPVSSRCSFCTAERGAIVFQDNGQARFVDGTGAPIAARSGYVGIASRDNTRAYLFAVSGPTSFVQSYAN
ncbi:MAG: Tfp pilus assembly protein FimT/FimU [Myxococcaceae bacterium]